MWPARFSAGRTFRQYLPHAEQACVLFGYNPGWKTEAAAEATEGLARAGGRVGAPRQAAPIALFVRTLRSASMAGEFIQAVWVSWAFLLRAQSEYSPLESEYSPSCWGPIQMPSGRMGEDSILKTPEVVGIWNPRLALGLHRRKRKLGGSRIIGGGICDRYPAGALGTHVPQMFCPGSSHWGNARHGVHASERPLPNPTGQKLTARTRGAARGMGCEKSGCWGRTSEGHKRLSRSSDWAAASRGCPRQACGTHQSVALSYV